MQVHHETMLTAALEQLYLEGAVSLRWDQLYLWYDAERLAKRSYQDILERWARLCERQGYDEVPTLRTIYWNGKPTLTLIRDAFREDEDAFPLSKWA